jgi:hypothetical protein
VTDVGLAHFRDCKNLIELYLRRDLRSPKLIEELPACQIDHDGGVIPPKRK